MVYFQIKNLAIAIAALVLVAAVGITSAAGLLPELAPAKGEQCVEPTDVMRKNHFEFLLHKRDQTMRQGIRTPKYSLVECINCHVLPDENNQYVSHGSSEHFCATCHEVAAVTIDCFECHADKPVGEGHTLSGKLNGGSSEKLNNKSGILAVSLLKHSTKKLQTNN